jgi:adenosylcobyric acid synthase
MKNNKQTMRPIMFVGTGSDVGKSIINAAFCRIFKNDGYSPAPFKAQNMSLNSFATADGFEIGRAQAVQAEACGIPCQVEMNPILLKPTSNTSSQIVLNGKPIGNQSANEYFMVSDRNALFEEAMKSYHRLAATFCPMVIEGAGSISEINLREKDITNMRVALEVNADVYLIADIDRGGVFASVYGTLLLLTPEERKLVKGIIINKFRGDLALFDEGKSMLEKLCGIPVVSIIPYFRDIYIEDEDSVVLDKKLTKFTDDKINIVVVLLKHMSNFTDFNVLERIPEVNLSYSNQPEEIENADIVIIPGTKNTISDLQHLRKTGLAKAIITAHEKGKSVYGICGGFQIMGTTIFDPYGVEGDIPSISGLALLPVSTTITEEKTTEQCRFTFLGEKERCKGYEIHMGETPSDSNLCQLENGKSDGCYLNDKTWGTYIHGIFDNPTIIRRIVENAGGKVENTIDHNTFKEEQYDKLADLVRRHSDMEYIYQSMLKPESVIS